MAAEPVPLKRLILKALAVYDEGFTAEDAAELNEELGVNLTAPEWKDNLTRAWEAVRDDAYLEGR